MGTFSIWHWVILLVPAVIFFLLVLRMLWRFGTAPKPPADKAPLEILKQRLARGEIDKEEFEARRRIIGE